MGPDVVPGITAGAAPSAGGDARLAKLREAARQMEALFVDLLFKEMRKSAPQGGGLTGKPSQAEQTFGEMLDEKRAEELSKTGALGIAGVLERQLRSAVLGTSTERAR